MAVECFVAAVNPMQIRLTVRALCVYQIENLQVQGPGGDKSVAVVSQDGDVSTSKIHVVSWCVDHPSALARSRMCPLPANLCMLIITRQL